MLVGGQVSVDVRLFADIHHSLQRRLFFVSHPARIMVVDDEPDMCQVLGLQLSRAGYEVECISDAGSAFIKLSIAPFDLVLTDLMMPGMSGTDLLRMIRKAENDIPVIVLTGRESPDAEIAAAGLHVSAYLKKGTTSGPALVDAVARALENASLQ